MRDDPNNGCEGDYLVRSPPIEIIPYLRGNQTVKMEDSYLGMLRNDPYPDETTTITVPKSTFQLNF